MREGEGGGHAEYATDSSAEEEQAYDEYNEGDVICAVFREKLRGSGVLAVFVVELKVETKKASGTIEIPKRKNEMKFTAKFVFVKNATASVSALGKTCGADDAPNWNAAPEANMMRIDRACKTQDVKNHESQNTLSWEANKRRGIAINNSPLSPWCACRGEASSPSQSRFDQRGS